MTMIVVTHEIAFAREMGDTLTFMDGGVVVESGIQGKSSPTRSMSAPGNS